MTEPPAPAPPPGPASAPPPERRARRLSPLTPLVRGALFLVAGAAATWQDVFAGRLGPGAVAVLGGLAVGAVYGVASWLRTRFWIGEDELRVDTGVLYQQSRRVRIDRLQGVDIVQPLVARLLGLAEVRVDVAGGEREAALAYLPLAEAHEVRALLLARRDAARAGGPGAQPGAGPGSWAPPRPPDRVVARLDLGTLLVSLLLSWESVAVVAGALVGLAALSGGVPLAAGSAVPAALGLLLVQLRRLAAYHGFTVSRTAEGLQVRRGLLERSTQTIALPRVQGVVVTEPVLWRRLGWARLDVALAGYAAVGDGEGPAASTVMPVAPRALVLALAGHLLGPAEGGETDPDAVPLSPPPAAARWLDPVGRRVLGFGLDADLAVSRQGVLARRTHVVRHARVQSWRLTQGPVQRRLGLADLRLDSPPGPVAVRARHRAAAEARVLLERARDLARSARSG